MLTRQSLKPVAAGIAVFFTLFQIWFTSFGVLEGTQMRADFVAFVMVLIFLLKPPYTPKNGRPENPLVILCDLCCCVLAIAIAAYITLHTDEIMERMRYVDDIPETARWLGILAVVLTLEVTRRMTGWPLVIIRWSSWPMPSGATCCPRR